MERGTDAIGVTFASFMTFGPQAALTAAARAKELGYRSFWTAETTGGSIAWLTTNGGTRGPGRRGVWSAGRRCADFRERRGREH